MAPSTRNALLLALLAGSAAANAAAPVAGTPKSAASPFRGAGDIKIDAASFQVDYKSNTTVFNDVTISQGETSVQAERARATGLNLDDSKWTFEGKVRINAEGRGNMRSDLAVVEFRDNHILKATATGKPADFEQQRAGSDQIARGHADQIVYDVSDGTVRLSQNAWVSDGRTQISGPLLVYDIRAEKVQAVTAPGTGQRVRITIPQAPGASKDPVSSAPPTPDTGKPQATPQS